MIQHGNQCQTPWSVRLGELYRLFALPDRFFRSFRHAEFSGDLLDPVYYGSETSLTGMTERVFANSPCHSIIRLEPRGPLACFLRLTQVKLTLRQSASQITALIRSFFVNQTRVTLVDGPRIYLQIFHNGRVEWTSGYLAEKKRKVIEHQVGQQVQLELIYLIACARWS